MDIIAFTFYLFSASLIVSALLVVMARNPVHAVLWLIVAFFSAAGFFILMGAEFIAMILAIVYVGAVAVLFLFVVMMLDVDFAGLKSSMNKFIPIGLLIGVILLAEFTLIFGQWIYADNAMNMRQTPIPNPAQVHNTQALGRVLYTEYIYMFQLAGLILLVAMIGAIVLTLRHRPHIKRQNVHEQMHRNPQAAIELKNIKSRQGL